MAADEDTAAVDDRGNTLAHPILPFLTFFEDDALIVCVASDSLGDWMGQALLGGSRQLKHFFGANTVMLSMDADHPCFALGQGACLIEDDGVHLSQLLEGAPAPESKCRCAPQK